MSVTPLPPPRETPEVETPTTPVNHGCVYLIFCTIIFWLLCAVTVLAIWKG